MRRRAPARPAPVAGPPRDPGPGLADPQPRPVPAGPPSGDPPVAESSLADSSLAESPLAKSPLAKRPGFLVRRLHQIFTATYLQSCERFGTTPVQSAVLQVLLARPGLDQAAIAAEIGMDRTTTSLVLGRLQARSLLRREVDRADRRSRRAFLTGEGEALIRGMQGAIEDAHRRLLEPLGEADRTVFMDLLLHLVSAGDDQGRAPLRSV